MLCGVCMYWNGMLVASGPLPFYIKPLTHLNKIFCSWCISALKLRQSLIPRLALCKKIPRIASQQ